MGDGMPSPWEWIIEKLVDNKDIGTALLKALIISNPDFSITSIQERFALRYVEEILLLGKFDAPVIPLVKLLLPPGDDLLLRLSTEVVLGHVRGTEEYREIDWKGFEEALNRLFPEGDLSTTFITRRNELSRVLEDKNTILSILEKHPIEALKHDLHHFVRQKKTCLSKTILDQLDDDIFEGRYSPPSSLHYKHASRGQECPTDGGMKQSPTEATLACENIDSKDTYVQCKPETHDNGDTGITQISSGTESTDDDHYYHGTGTEENLHDLEEEMIEPDGEKDPKATGGSVDQSLEVEWVPESSPLIIGKDGYEEVCHKCKKVGELLRCNDCRIAVHESCIGSDRDIGVINNFYCPLCSYKRASAAFKKAKEQLVDSKKRLLAFADRKLVQKHRESSLGCEKSKRKGRISIDKGQNFNEPSSTFDLVSQGAQLHQQGKICGIPFNDDNKPVGSRNGQCGTQTDCHDDDRHNEDPEEDSIGAVKYDLRHQRPAMRGSITRHGLRRKVFPWTNAEEECLKEAVQRFSGEENRNLPWKRILEFSREKFHNTRTAVDLKNKWWKMKRDIS